MAMKYLPEANLGAVLKGSFDYLLTLQLPDGNWPSSEGKQSNQHMLQFCHGATGAVAPLVAAYETF
jgi:hypothetical protein